MAKLIWTKEFDEIYTPSKCDHLIGLLKSPSGVLNRRLKEEIFYFVSEAEGRFCRGHEVSTRKIIRNPLERSSITHASCCGC